MDSPNNFCRLCGTVLRGNHRRWLFSRSGGSSHPDLQVVLSYVLSREPPSRGDGCGEFLCGKCAQALGRVYRFDTVIARVQALSIDRLQRLLSEKDQLARSLRYIHARRFPDGNDLMSYVGQEISAEIADLPHVRYQRLLQDDMALSEYECWANDTESSRPGTPCRNRHCRCCHGLRVEDSVYEWVCQTPRRLGMSSPVFPLCRDKSQSMPTVHHAGSHSSSRSQSLGDAESCSLLSLETLPESDLIWEAFRALRSIERKRLKVPKGSKIPVLAGNRYMLISRRESPLGEEAYEDMMDDFVPLESKVKSLKLQIQQNLHGAFKNLKERLEAAEEELRSLQKKQGDDLNQEAGAPPKKATHIQEQLIQRLTRCLQTKEEVLQDCIVILQSIGLSQDIPSTLEAPIKQMAQRLKERDQAFEKTLSNHFLVLGSLQQELKHLQEALKDKDADLTRLHTALRTGEETLHALRDVLHQKEQEIRRQESLSASTRESWHQRDQTLGLALKEKDALIKALQEALTSSTKDVEALANSLASPEFAPGLLQRIQEKEELLTQALAEQEQKGIQWQRLLQAVEKAAAARQQELQEQLQQRSQDALEWSQEGKTLRRCLAQTEAEAAQRATALQECRSELARLQRMADEKDQALEKALQEAEEKDQILRKLQEWWLKTTLGGGHKLEMKPTPGRKGQPLLPPT